VRSPALPNAGSEPALDLFPPGVLAASAAIGSDAGALFPEEARLVEAAVASRRREFAAGRCAARALLAQLGEPPRPLLRDAHRAPVWPNGVVGSISHANDRVAVALTRIGSVCGLGLDLAPAAPLEAELWPKICTSAELAHFRASALLAPGVSVRLAFSAKEALYKCVHRFALRFIGFREVELALRGDGSFEARLPADVERTLPRDFALVGRYRVEAGWISAGASLVQESAARG
jgi:4'-phosphopantetheinyl transferase EntD